MSDDTDPTMVVETDGVRIEVTDRHTANLALKEIDRVLTHYLSETSHVDRDTVTRQQRHDPVDVQCQQCGYEWTYRGQSPAGSTCPMCKQHTRFDPPLDDRGLR